MLSIFGLYQIDLKSQSCFGDYAQLISNFGRYQKTPMGKKRAKILEGDDEEKGKDGKKKK